MLSLGLDERVPTHLKFSIRHRAVLFSFFPFFFFSLRTSILSRDSGGTERSCDSYNGDLSLKKFSPGHFIIILFHPV